MENSNIDLSYDYTSWVQITLVLKVEMQKTSISVYKSTELITTIDNQFYYIDSSTALYFCPLSDTNGFTGFIWNVFLFHSSSETIPNVDAPTSMCTINTYPDSCELCPDTCEHSCRDNRCNLCDDILCDICTRFSRSCIQCSDLSNLQENLCTCKNLAKMSDGKCVCKDLAYNLNNECVCKSFAYELDGECVCKDLAYNLDNECVCKSLTSDLNNICSCKYGATVLNGECVCKTGFYLNNNECSACYKYCKNCLDSEIDSCTECPQDLDILPEGICGICKLGYTKTNDICQVKNGIIFELKLNNTINGVMTDSASSIKVITGLSSKFYRDYENDDPYAAFLRGFYFNGIQSFLSIESNLFRLPHSHQLAFWVNFEKGVGTVFKKQDLSIGIDSFTLKACI